MAVRLAVKYNYVPGSPPEFWRHFSGSGRDGAAATKITFNHCKASTEALHAANDNESALGGATPRTLESRPAARSRPESSIG
jgi:hypothetical protein